MTILPDKIGVVVQALTRTILASTFKGAWILDPFAGSSTTGIAANLSGRNYLGIDKELELFNHYSLQNYQQ